MAIVNNVPTDWVKLEVSIPSISKTFEGITSVSYGAGVEFNAVYGRGKKPYGFTEGAMVFEDGSLEISLAEWNNLQQTIGADVIFTDAGKFDMTITYQIGSDVKLDTLVGCRVSNFSVNPAQGPDPINVTVTFKYLDLR